MKQIVCAILAWIALGIFSASATHRPRFERAIDMLCAGEVKLLERTGYADLRYYVRVPLLVEGRKHSYRMHLDDNFRIRDFEPEGCLSFLVDSLNTLLVTTLTESQKDD
jgi:hypothetical protein